MKRFLFLFFAVLLLTAPVSASVNGAKQPAFVRAVKAKKIRIRRVRVGGVILMYDRAVKGVHVRRVKAWIRALPRMVRTSARHVYLLSRLHFRLTADRGELADTYGYYIYPQKDIYLWPTSAGRLKHTLYHEFGHAFDSRVRLHQYSVSSAWRRLMRGDRVERFADVFADIWITLTAPAYQYVFNLIYGG